MLALSRGELAIVAFIFVLVWAPRVLPAAGSWLAERLLVRGGSHPGGEP